MIPDIGISMLKQNGFSVDICPGEAPPSQKKIISHLKKNSYDGMISLLTDPIDKNIFEAAPTLKIVSNYATGFDNVDIEEAKKHGVVVTNSPSALASESVAEHTLTLMLSLTTRVVDGDRYMRAGKYKGWSPMTLLGTDFKGKVVGLIGVGRIGSDVAEMAYKGFGAKIIYFDIVTNEKIERECQAERAQSIEGVLSKADLISLHTPLMDSTHHLINETRLKVMKPTAFLINTSRGPVVDEKALVEALKNKIIAGAGLDVFEFEPKPSRGLMKLSNVILTPHIASSRQAARDDMAKIAAQSIIDFFGGKEPKNKV